MNLDGFWVLEGIKAWLVGSGIMNLLSIFKLRHEGFMVQTDTYAN